MTDIAGWLHGRLATFEPSRPLPPRSAATDSDPGLRAIAFYLPQYHPIAENDAWWGAGFTEWTNVVRGRPLFADHHQPQLPGELGFYDLRLPEVRSRQAELALAHGIAGFCYYHYWFDGHRLLERPFQEVLASGAPDFPFCLCWANENWSRRWDGSEHEILIAQCHSPEDDCRLIEQLLPAFADSRYIRIGGRPLFLVYRPLLLPNPRATADCWREVCQRAGLGELFLCNVHSFDTADPSSIGFDAAVEFPPNLKHLPRANHLVSDLDPAFTGWILDYDVPLAFDAPSYPLFRGVFPAWDNTTRRGTAGTVIAGSSPERYGEYLADVCAYTVDCLPRDRRLIFINAWNEWAEGCHLEPDARYGRAYLEQTRDVLDGFRNGAYDIYRAAQ